MTPAHVDTHARHAEVFLEYERAKLALLLVNERIAKMNNDFYGDGLKVPHGDRYALFAERDAAEIEVQTLKVKALELKEAARALKSKTFLLLLIAKAEAAGQHSIVEEARLESIEALDAAGLRRAYSMKGPA